ncbi:hypothetical protein GCM10022205_06210 [Spinactinospora alkalitolerans]
MRQWGVAGVGTAASLVLLGIPAVLIPNGLFSREIEPTWWSYPVWAATALLCGLLLATYAGPTPPTRRKDPTGPRGLGGGILAWLAIGCPVCNKLVLLAVGTSGALTWFAPLQPLLAVGGLILLAAALRTRLRAAASCPAPESQT